MQHGNFIEPSQSGTLYDGTDEEVNGKIQNFDQMREKEYIEGKKGTNFLTWLGSGIVGVLVKAVEVIALLLATAVRGIIGAIAMVGGVSQGASTGDAILISPDDVIFNKFNITNINFFNTNGLDGAMKAIRENIAIWYYGLRNLAIVMLLAVLVYVGIRMAISTTGEDKAKYKKMLVDWFVSFALIFVLHYIMLFIINVNEALVGVFDSANQAIRTENEAAFGFAADDLVDVMADLALENFGVYGFAATIAYIWLIGTTLIFLIMYIKRMITISFLCLISPIITVTYSIDKIKDNKSQALNAWFKEFIYNILIQPFHCLIYLCFVSSAISILRTGTIAGAVITCLFLNFILKAEGIIKNIFDFHARSMPEKGSGMVGLLVAGQALASAGKKSSGGGGGGKAPSGSSGGSADLEKNVKSNPTIKSSGTTSDSSSDSSGSSSSSRSSSDYASSGTSSSGSGSVSSSKPMGAIGKTAHILGKHITKGRTGKEFAKDTIKGVAKNSAVMAGRLVLAGLAASSGDMSKVATTVAGGEIFRKKMENDHSERIMKNNEKRLAKSHNDFQESSGMTDDEMLDFTNEILSTDPTVWASTHKGEDAVAYANMVYGQRDIYKAQGYEAKEANEKLLNTIEQVQAGTIQPKIMDDMRDKHY